jgi:hypothetical protein
MERGTGEMGKRRNGEERKTPDFDFFTFYPLTRFTFSARLW